MRQKNRNKSKVTGLKNKEIKKQKAKERDSLTVMISQIIESISLLSACAVANLNLKLSLRTSSTS